MKRLLLAAAALAMTAGAASAAQTVIRHHPNGTTTVKEQRHGDTVAKFRFGGRYYNRVRGPVWTAPAGWRYQRFVVGATLPALLLTDTYYVDPIGLGLGLPVAGPGRHWVRVGNDLVLVKANGVVVQVVPDVYY